ncbi:hypothetical protein [Nostoc punctiforme]|uniref:Uncharacterized protein n=1 Tax=Nostoc punctiforme (strain ATCC 29133 / PCC 73102) TaxID=63737 RepID=B2J089_NOSP7|nr:hypothetical protein [Nostoc punctiforme]ACC83241.1 hypothetical protein Npun_F4895 [Nostoc punctiforme PCC 73102]
MQTKVESQKNSSDMDKFTNTTSNFDSQHYPFVNKQVASKLTGLSGDTLKRYRLQGKLQKDIHWVVLNSRVVRYNITLVLDWVQNHISNPNAHLRAIDNYLAYLPSNQRKRRKTRS